MMKLKKFYKKHSFSIDFVMNIICSLLLFLLGVSYYRYGLTFVSSTVDKITILNIEFIFAISIILVYKSIKILIEEFIDLYKYKKLRKERAQNDCINLDSCDFSNNSNGGISNSNDCDKKQSSEE